jgi:ketosteroid isomerase-like protein
MSEENIAILRRFADAANRRDLTALLSCCDPDIEIHSSRLLLGTPVYRGHAGIERWFRDMAAAWEDLQGELVEVVAVGPNELVVLGKGTGRGKTTGAPFVSENPMLVKFRSGRVAHVEWFSTKEDAVEAAGLSE